MLELTFGEIARLSLVGLVRKLRAGGPATLGALGIGVVAALWMMVGSSSPAAVETAEAAPEPDPVSTIAQMRPVDPQPERTAVAPELPPEGDLSWADVEPWRQVFGAQDDDTAEAALALPGGDFAFVGRSVNPEIEGFSDVVFLRTTADGVVRAQTILASLGPAVDVTADASATGEIYVLGKERAAFTLVQLDISGDMLWGAAFAGGESLSSPAVAALDDGAIVVAPAPEGAGVLAVRFDGTGRELWRRVVETGPLTGKLHVAAHVEGAVLGFVETGADDAEPVTRLALLDEAGEIGWRTDIGVSGARLDGVDTLPTGGIFASGVSEGAPWIVAFAGDGSSSWRADFDDMAVISPVVMDARSGAGIHLSGALFSADGPDIWLARFSDTGDLLWDTSVASPAAERVGAIAVTEGADIVVAGAVVAEDGLTHDMMMVRFARGGVPPLALGAAVDTSPAERTVPVAARSIPAPEPTSARTLDRDAPAEPVLASVPLADSGFDRPEPITASATRPDPVEVPQAAEDAPEPVTGEAEATETAEVGESAPAAVPTRFSYTCEFRCKADESGAIKYPVSQAYTDVDTNDPDAFSYEIEGDAAGVCEASGGLRDGDMAPVCR